MRPYYKSRKLRESLSEFELYFRIQSLFEIFRQKDYFKEKTGISAELGKTSSLNHEANFHFGFNAFPLDQWQSDDVTFDNLFSIVEFLYDRVSKPGHYGELQSSQGIYWDYYSYDEAVGRAEFRETANAILSQAGEGFELNTSGDIQTLGSHGLDLIAHRDIPAFDEENVDSKVRLALRKWLSRTATNADKKEAVRILADVFEFLRKSDLLDKVLNKKDDSDLFLIANKFAIRHHNPQQKTEYDKAIWYSWMFHFYLASYHATIRLIQKNVQKRP
jgi:hypothetical protein